MTITYTYLLRKFGFSSVCAFVWKGTLNYTSIHIQTRFEMCGFMPNINSFCQNYLTCIRVYQEAYVCLYIHNTHTLGLFLIKAYISKIVLNIHIICTYFVVSFG